MPHTSSPYWYNQAMYGQYLTVIRVLRLPMRQWWLKHGKWWVGGYIACLLLIVVLPLVFHQCFVNYGEENPIALAIIGLQSTLLVIRRLLFILTWLFASLAVLQLFDKHLLEILQRFDEKMKSKPAPKPSLAFLRFQLAMTQAFGLILLAVVFYWINGFLDFWMITDRTLSSLGSLFSTFPPSYWSNESLSYFADKLLWFGWMSGLLAVTGKRHVLVWLWVGLTYLFPSFISLVQGYYWDFVEYPGASSYSLFVAPYIWLVSIIAAIVMIGSFRSRRVVLAYVMFGTFLLSSLIGTLSSVVLFAQHGLRITGMLSILGLLHDGLRFMPANFSSDVFVSFFPNPNLNHLNIRFPPFGFSQAMPAFLEPLAGLFNLAWVLLIFTAMAAFALRSSKWVKETFPPVSK